MPQGVVDVDGFGEIQVLKDSKLEFFQEAFPRKRGPIALERHQVDWLNLPRFRGEVCQYFNVPSGVDDELMKSPANSFCHLRPE